jgi:hypothetical protein
LFAAWDHNGIRFAEFFARGDPAQFHCGLGFKWIEVREVAEGRQLEHSNLEVSCSSRWFALEQVKGILRWENIVEPGHDAKDWHPCVVFEPGSSFIEEFSATSKAVDQDPFHERAFDGPKQGEGANDLGKNTSPFDVGNEQAIRSQILSQPEIGEVAPLQVHLHRAACSLQHQTSLRPLLLQFG